MSFAENLKQLRKDKGQTQGDLSSRCGKPPCWISNYECGRRTPSIENLKIIASELCCSYGDLID